MADFLSNGWSIAIAVIVIASLIACLVLLISQSTVKVKIGQDGKPLPAETTGHVWDEDLMEKNNPLPKWWMWLFYATVIFSAGYLVVYPGLGSYQGYFGWSTGSAYQKEIEEGEKFYGPIFNKYLSMDIPAVAADEKAREIGQRLFLNSCAQCHGSDAQGAKGYPNLSDSDWLYGGSPATIKESITHGRQGMMPPMAEAVGSEEDVRNVAHYVLSLSNSTHDPVKASLGKPKFMACAACHGADGKGNQLVGAPNLTDKTWLYGGSADMIVETIKYGRSNKMPAHKELLGEAKIHLIAAYVWGLSNNGKSAQPTEAEATALKQIGDPDISNAAPTSASSEASSK